MNDDIRIRIGFRIRELREARGLSIRALAELSGLNKSTIMNLEAGRFDARLDTLGQIAGVFNMKIDFVSSEQ